jgi:Na+-driven multidrug efflux pump
VAAQAIPVLFGVRFEGAREMTLVLLPGCVLFSALWLSAPYINGTLRRPEVAAMLSAAAFAIDALLLMSLWRLGGLGASIASSLAYGVVGGVTIALVVRTSNTSGEWLSASVWRRDAHDLVRSVLGMVRPGEWVHARD